MANLARSLSDVAFTWQFDPKYNKIYRTQISVSHTIIINDGAHVDTTYHPHYPFSLSPLSILSPPLISLPLLGGGAARRPAGAGGG